MTWAYLIASKAVRVWLILVILIHKFVAQYLMDQMLYSCFKLTIIGFHSLIPIASNT